MKRFSQASKTSDFASEVNLKQEQLVKLLISSFFSSFLLENLLKKWASFKDSGN